MSLMLFAVAVSIALTGLVVWQLARRKADTTRGISAVFLALAVILVPLVGVIGYQHNGSSHLVAIDELAAKWTDEVNTGLDASATTAELTQQIALALSANPEQERLLFLAAQLDKQAGRYVAAEAKFAQMVALSPNDPQIAAEYAQVSYFANRGIVTRAIQERFDRALELDPVSRPILALLAIHSYQNQQPEQALAYWQRLLRVMPMDSPNRGAIVEAIEQVSSELGLDQSSRVIVVNVSLPTAIELQSTATVFVVARPSAQGAPLAVKRLTASSLPAQVTLSNQDAMLAGHNITNYDEFMVYAVLSQSGQVGKRQGDWESATFSVANEIEILDVVIDRQVE